MKNDARQSAPPPHPDHAATRKLVEDFILDELLFGAARSDLAAGVRLVSDGMIDSMSSLRLAFFLEAAFNVAIPPEWMTAEHLDSVDAIIHCIDRCRTRPQQQAADAGA